MQTPSALEVLKSQKIKIDELAEKLEQKLDLYIMIKLKLYNYNLGEQIDQEETDVYNKLQNVCFHLENKLRGLRNMLNNVQTITTREEF